MDHTDVHVWRLRAGRPDRPDGTIRPESLEWEDGQVWEITRTIHVAAPADHEFEGIRDTVLIGSAEKYIYRTGNRWYVEPVRMEVDSS
ncbi:hypothetical protein FYJ60_10675 [Lachnospiraceae bacterium Oil+RF-744-WCA-WT-13]|uniref:Uncharacterized protein n=1 Tax=Bilifractor porci TaxID=2606636 RepID=A0A7X2TNZ4_9FIRM|nr:hypothetical protein [Bilifractor porci]